MLEILNSYRRKLLSVRVIVLFYANIWKKSHICMNSAHIPSWGWGVCRQNACKSYRDSYSTHWSRTSIETKSISYPYWKEVGTWSQASNKWKPFKRQLFCWSVILNSSTTLKLRIRRCIKVLGKEKSARLGRLHQFKTWGNTKAGATSISRVIFNIKKNLSTRWVFEIYKIHRHEGCRLSVRVGSWKFSAWYTVSLPACVVVQSFT
jgi:hypothetical protein